MNPDVQAVRRFCRAGSAPAPVDSNPLAVSLETVLRRVDLDAQVIELSFRAGPQFVQGAGVVQGGILATMLDFASGFVVMAVIPDGMTIATAQLGVSYLRPAPAGEFIAVAEVERCGRTVAFTRARLVDADGRVVATATSVCSIFIER